MYNSAIAAMLQSGADAQKNMYDTYITFPWANDSEEVIVSTRATAFAIKEAAVGTEDRSYHGNTVKVPTTQIDFDRTFDLTFRLDASYALYQQFITWHSTVGDPVNGGVANFMTATGMVRVQALSGTYAATSVHNYENTSTTYDIADADINAEWTFYDVWVQKVTQPQFNNDGGGHLEYTVSFVFGDTNYPYYDGGGIQGSTNGEGGMASLSQ